jgi:lipid-binding SYLF domain-containing protein
MDLRNAVLGIVVCAAATAANTGGSVGAQIGGSEIDVILVIMNRTGVEHLLANQIKLGGEISAAAGPLGRAAEASTDLLMHAQILSYSRSRSLSGTPAVESR